MLLEICLRSARVAALMLIPFIAARQVELAAAFPLQPTGLSFFQRSLPCRLSGAIEHQNGIPLHWRGLGVGYSERKDPPLKAEAFFPLPRGDFHGSTEKQKLPKQGTGSVLISLTFDKNDFDPDERGMISLPPEVNLDADAEPYGNVVKRENGQIELRDVPVGSHRLTISHPSMGTMGTVTENVEVQPGLMARLHLIVVRALAFLVVKSEVGAQIYVDERLRDQISESGSSGRIELRPGKHKLKVAKSGFKTSESIINLPKGTQFLPRSLERLQFSEPFVDQLLEGLKFWEAPASWQVERGTLKVSGPGRGLLRDKLYKDFAFSFQIRFVNGRGAAWVVRAQPDESFYLFQLVLPTQRGEPSLFNSFKIQKGREKQLQSLQVPENLSQKGTFTIYVSAVGNKITHEIEVPDRKPQDLPVVKMGILDDREEALEWGRVGFATKNNEEFIISGPQISPIENTDGYLGTLK